MAVTCLKVSCWVAGNQTPYATYSSCFELMDFKITSPTYFILPLWLLVSAMTALILNVLFSKYLVRIPYRVLLFAFVCVIHLYRVSLLSLGWLETHNLSALASLEAEFTDMIHCILPALFNLIVYLKCISS